MDCRRYKPHIKLNRYLIVPNSQNSYIAQKEIYPGDVGSVNLQGMAKHKAKDGTDRGAKGKYNNVVDTIIELKETTDNNARDICKAVGIDECTYYEWLKTKPEFSKAIKEADQKRLNTMAAVARQALFKKVSGYEVEEVTTEYIPGEGGKPSIKIQKKTKKHISASDTLIMYALNNTDPDNFKHKEHIDHTSKGKKVGFDYGGMTTEQILERAKAVKKLEDEQDEQQEDS